VHIAIAGNIGCGKTTLTNMLAQHYGWEPKFEAVSYNPYLEDYYRDIPRWSFNMEVFFLKERFRDILEIAQTEKTVIQDRSIYEGVYVFVANNYRMGHLSQRDYEAYMELFDLMTDMVKYPDLMIYLRASIPHLVSNIQKRGRMCEQAIQLERLIYGEWKRFELLKLCFPWLHKVEVQGGDNADFVCCVECKHGCRASSSREYENLSRAISYLTCHTLVYQSYSEHGGWSGLCLYYVMRPGSPWIERKEGEDIYLPEGNPQSLYHGGPL